MRCALAAFVFVGGFACLSPGLVVGQAAPYCRPGEPTRFQFGFAELAGHLESRMGEPVECEHANADGDVVQLTTTGLALYRRRSNTPTFIAGLEHWALTRDGLTSWVGLSLDPPDGAGLAQPPQRDLALDDAVRRFGVDRDSIEVLRVESTEWSDSSLGCTQPGGAYLQVLTPGWLIELRAAGRTLEYHTDSAFQIVLCAAR